MATATATTGAGVSLKDMIAVSKDSQLPRLGYINWYTVPDADVSVRRLRRVWGVAGLDMRCLPKDPKAVNAFKRAVSDQDGTHINTATGTKTVTDVRPVLENEQDVIYQLSRVVSDADDKRVDYPKALRVWFSKVTEDIDFKPLGEIPRSEVMPIMDEITDAYEKAAKTVTGAKVRDLVRSYISKTGDESADIVGLSGENMRGKAGGVYFVLARYEAQLEALSGFLEELYEPHGRAYMVSLPMADSASEREIIRRQHVTNSIAEMEEAMADAASLLRSDRQREVRSDVAQHHWGKLQRVKRRAAEYAAALESEQDELEAHMDALQLQLKRLV